MNNSPYMVTRCVCFKKSFAELKEIARKNRATSLEELQAAVRFGFNCKRCHPYVRLMLATGRTVFPLLPEASEP